MSFQNFIPKIWNSVLLEEFRQKAIFAALTNSDYTGDAQVGNKVQITTALPVAIKDYQVTKGEGENAKKVRETTPDEVETTSMDLLIDQEKVFDFLIDDIDKRQAAGSVATFARGAAWGLRDDADKWIAAQIVAGAAEAHQLTGNLTDNGKAVWNIVRDLRRKLNKAKVPTGDRVLVLNAEFEALILGFDSKLTAVELAAGSPNGLRDAYLGRVLGFEVYTSENLPETEKPQVAAFHKSAYAFVNQITKTEPMRAEKQFSDRLRGLNVYGGKTIRPEAIATFTAN